MRIYKFILNHRAGGISLNKKKTLEGLGATSRVAYNGTAGVG
jgi:hypothetical protein